LIFNAGKEVFGDIFSRSINVFKAVEILESAVIEGVGQVGDNLFELDKVKKETILIELGAGDGGFDLPIVDVIRLRAGWEIQLVAGDESGCDF
jgi:hypothetical protein